MKKSFVVVLALLCSCAVAPVAVPDANPADDTGSRQIEILVCKGPVVDTESNICDWADEGYVPTWSQIFFTGLWNEAEFTVVATGRNFRTTPKWMATRACAGSEDVIFLTAFDFFAQKDLPQEKNYAVKVKLAGEHGLMADGRFIVRTGVQMPNDPPELPVDDSMWGW